MEWSKQHDVLILREVLVSEPFRFRKGSAEKGKIWTEIADRLNDCREASFKVNQRSVRERCSLLETKFRKKTRDEERASGISVEVSEQDVLLEEILEKEQAAEVELDVAKGKKVDDKNKAEEMRRKAMERMSKRKVDDTEEGSEGTSGASGSKRSRRRSGSDTIEYLKEKGEMERELKEKELEIRKTEAENQKDMMTMLLQQQQQQTQAMMAMIQQLAKKN